LRSDWLIYDNATSLLVPYIPSIHSRLREVHFKIDINLYQDSKIQIRYAPKTGFFINNTLVDYSEREETRIYSIDSLSENFKDSSFLVSLSTRTSLEGLETLIITPYKGLADIFQGEMYLPVDNVPYSRAMEFIKIAVIMIFVLYAFFLNTGSRIFKDYYNISNTFIRVSVDEFLNRTAKLTRIDLIYLAGLSIVMSLAIFIIIRYEDAALENLNAGTLFGLFSTWIFLICILFFWYLIRIFLISLMADIFKIREIKVIHTFELIRMTNFFSLLFFLLIIIVLFILEMPFGKLGLILSRMILLFTLFRIIVLFLKFLNSTTYKKLYLFAYLCTAEIFPILVGLKLLLKSSYI
jgi:hypothetical protein